MKIVVEIRLHPDEPLSVAPHQLADALDEVLPAHVLNFLTRSDQGWDDDGRSFVRYQAEVPAPYGWKEEGPLSSSFFRSSYSSSDIT